MGVRILEGVYDSDTAGAVMICSTTMVAFGPVFDTEQECELFIEWFEKLGLGSVRMVVGETLAESFAVFTKLICECKCGELRFKADTCALCEVGA